jgi:hypothetical protein
MGELSCKLDFLPTRAKLVRGKGAAVFVRGLILVQRP